MVDNVTETTDRETSRKKILFIMQRAPYGSSTAREALDAALACAAFEQNVQLLFTGDGVWQLLPLQNAAVVGSKDIGKMLGALAYYDINGIFVDHASLQARELTVDQLAIPVISLDTTTLRQLVQEADCVISL
jgi:tRNA 2-thiouridine synthesizing protein C